mgnify:CR=1 FL=1
MHIIQKVSIVSLFLNLAFAIPLTLRQRGLAHPDLQAAVKSWGIYFLILMGGMVAVNILAAILIAIFSRGQGFDDPTDERDRMIELKAVRVFNILFFLSFLLFLSSFLPLFQIQPNSLPLLRGFFSRHPLHPLPPFPFFSSRGDVDESI